MTEREIELLIADSMETSPELLPYLPELLQDVWALGGNPDIVIDLLRPLGLPHGARLLDLGCGKGGVSLPVASALGMRVRGVDLFEPFLEEARSRARGIGLTCEFVQADLWAEVRHAQDFDVALYSALGVPVHGLELLRHAVRPGGYLVIDDCYLLEGQTVQRAGYENVLSREDSRARLVQFGDQIVAESVMPEDMIRELDRRVNAAIQMRASALVQQHPDAADLIQDYVHRQEEECRVLETQVANAIWVVRRS